jgi:hypothetical protein
MSDKRDSTDAGEAAKRPPGSPPGAQPTPPAGEASPAGRASPPPPSGPDAAAGAAGALPPGVARLLSPRVTAALAALMLGVGVAIGAAIGPAPTASFAGASRLVPLLPSLLGTTAQPSRAAAPAAGPAGEAPARKRRHRHRLQTVPAAAATAPVATAPAESAPAESAPASPTKPSAPLSNTPAGGSKTITPVTHVWLVELSGTSFSEALAQPAAAPYIDTQAVPQGALMSSWSSVAAGAFAGATALLASSPPQTVDTVVQPPCPEGAAGAACAPGTPGALTASDEFLKATLPALTATAAYREHGLVVVTFATVASATATGLPTGAATATLTSQPPTGVLLVSPFATAGSRPTSAFNPASPKQSIERLLRR